MITDFKELHVDPKVAKRLAPHLQSWHTVHAYISEMKDSAQNVESMSAMLAIETNSFGREVILTRVHMAMSAMRKRLEFQRLVKWMQ